MSTYNYFSPANNTKAYLLHWYEYKESISI